MLSKCAMDTRFAALQFLCNREVKLDNYFENFPKTLEEKETWEMRGNGPRMTEKGFNYCQLSYMRGNYRPSKTFEPHCPKTAEVIKEMDAWPMQKLHLYDYDDRYGHPLDQAKKVKEAIQADMASIKAAAAADAVSAGADMRKCSFVTPFADTGCDAETCCALDDEIVKKRKHFEERLEDLRKAEWALETLEHAYKCMHVVGGDLDAQRVKRTKIEKKK